MRDEVFDEGLEALKTTRLDVFAFIGAFIAGITSYLILREAGYGQFWQTVAIVICLLAYAFLVARVPRLRVRLDQAGDNAYYLGLLFTLASMAFALYDFGREVAAGTDEKSTAVILSNFGIALASTIVGIFLRVVLHQMRVDPADVENMTRIELAQAATRVKGTLDNISVEMGRSYDDIRQRTQDVVEDLTTKVQAVLTEFADSTSVAMNGLVQKAVDSETAMLEATTEAVSKLKSSCEAAEIAIEHLRLVEPPPLKLANRLNKVTESLEAVGVQINGVSEGMRKLGEDAASTGDSLAGATKEIAKWSESDQNAHAEAVDRLRAASNEVCEALEKVGRSLETDIELMKELEGKAKESESLVASSHKAANDVLKELASSARTVASVVQDGVNRLGR